jgi:hypothetical protein
VFEFRGYDLVHHDDLNYVASAHAECKYMQIIFLINNKSLINNIKCVFQMTNVLSYKLKLWSSV